MMLWQPVIGAETIDFLARVVPETSKETVRRSTLTILSHAIPPARVEGRETGLVVGYVQSGKTMSFEAAATLARDNRFQMVVVVTGTSNPLLDQSTGRLRKDLLLDDPGRARNWVLFENPGTDDPTVRAMRNVLDDWADPGTPDEFKKTILVTVLKHHQRLRNLSHTLGRVGMRGVPVLVIDDEADQASLNTDVGQGEESSTYHQLMVLRRELPNHTYLQYTATPQAPLLINIIDSLSPSFVHVLEPGEDYVGGREFFAAGSRLTRLIPSDQVPTKANPLAEPPATLLEALRFFMVGVTAGIVEGRNSGNRSMLVHPSHLTAQHQEFYNWVRDAMEEWKRLLALSENEPDRQELIEDLRETHEELRASVGEELPTFDVLVPSFRFAFRNTRLQEMNARGGRTPEVDWRSAYGWILVGGQAMDRGFTVEGLTVTYMPRGIGVGNADTVQQRARFFGYKRKYLGYCRVYLEQGTLEAFENYVDHEEDIRQQLQEYSSTGRPLAQWKRAFLLDEDLRPCRQSVITFDYIRGQFSDEWVSPKVVLSEETIVDSNRRVVDRYVSRLAFVEVEGHPQRTEIQRHVVCRNLLLREVIADLLVSLRITGTTDSQRNTGMLLQLSRALEANPGEQCTIIRISPRVQRRRSVDDDGEISNLFQGAAPVQPRERRGEIYPGDMALRDDNLVTIQVHSVDLTKADSDPVQVLAENVPVVAVWIPARMERGWLHQNQPGQ